MVRTECSTSEGDADADGSTPGDISCESYRLRRVRHSPSFMTSRAASAADAGSGTANVRLSIAGGKSPAMAVFVIANRAIGVAELTEKNPLVPVTEPSDALLALNASNRSATPEMPRYAPTENTGTVNCPRMIPPTAE